MKKIGSTVKHTGYAAAALFVLIAVLGGARGGYGETSGIHEGLRDRAFLVLKTEKPEAYLNEQIRVTLTLYSDGVTVREVHSPRFSSTGVAVEEFGAPARGTETRNGTVYETLTFTAHLYGKNAGALRIGPVRLRCTLLDRSEAGPEAFFGGHTAHTVELESDAVPLKVLPLPRKGHPAAFSGAVGEFTFTARITTTAVRVGDPVTVVMMLRGDGVLAPAACPEFEASDTLKVYGAQTVLREGVRECEQVVVPLTESMTEIPPLRFSFFDPLRKAYRTIQQGPFPLSVLPAPAAELIGPQVQAKPQAQTIPKALLALACALCLAAAALVYRKQREKIRRSLAAYRRRRHTSKRIRERLRKTEEALERGNLEEFYTLVFRTLQECLGTALNIAPAGITADIVGTIPELTNVDDAVRAKIIRLFEECDRVRYAHSVSDPQHGRELLFILKEIYTYFNIYKV